MYNDHLYLEAVNGERDELLARYRRERAGMRAAAANDRPTGARTAFARLFVAVLYPRRRPTNADARAAAETGTSSTAAS